MEFGALMMFRNPPPWRRPIQEVYRGGKAYDPQTLLAGVPKSEVGQVR